MDVCRNAPPHVGTCVGVLSSWNNDTPIFRTSEASWNQRVSFCAKLVIFAHEGLRDLSSLSTFAPLAVFDLAKRLLFEER
jgi:hypothetical protein